VPSTSCSGIRVTPGTRNTSVLVNKLRAQNQTSGWEVAVCAKRRYAARDHRSINARSAALVENWINAGALNN